MWSLTTQREGERGRKDEREKMQYGLFYLLFFFYDNLDLIVTFQHTVYVAIWSFKLEVKVELRNVDES